MRITHLCLACFFPDGFSYQENMLPKYHRKLGHEVRVIASLQSFDKNGRTVYLEPRGEYRNEHDVRVLRLPYAAPVRVNRKLRRYRGLTEALEQASPEILFIHGCQFADMKQVVGYLKSHPGVRVFVDNHADYGNSAQGWISMKLLHRQLWRRCARMIEPYAQCFYGVTPARVSFLTEVYGIPADRVRLLVMGADDDEVQKALEPAVRASLRERFGVGPETLLLVSGGKINAMKRHTLDLMKAVNQIADPRLNLVVFGSVEDALKPEFEAQLSDFVKSAGWIPSAEAYSYFAAADLVVFPGSHSVLWEQAAGMGKPLLCNQWPGVSHLDQGGNVLFLSDCSDAAFCKTLRGFLDDPDLLERMRLAAEGPARAIFSYRDIAARSILPASATPTSKGSV